MARIHSVLSAFVLSSCGPLAGVSEKPCQPGCVDERTRLVCDSQGTPTASPCPEIGDPCVLSRCTGGSCSVHPAVGASCGPSGLARCNEGYACLGPNTQLSASFNHTCALADDGKIWCWGQNQYRQLGDGSNEAFRANPVAVVGLPARAIAVSAGFANTCAVVAGGDVYCWGDSMSVDVNVPRGYVNEATRVGTPEGVRFSAVRAGGAHTCALATDGTVYCWGYTPAGECGVDGAVTGIVAVGPTLVPNLDRVASIEAVKDHTCAIRKAQPSLVCWGDNTHENGPDVVHKLGPNADRMTHTATPVAVDLPGEVIRLGVGYDSTYAVISDGRMYAFGRNTAGQLGTESTDPVVATPSLVSTRVSPERIAPLQGIPEEIVRAGTTNECVRMDVLSLGHRSHYLCWGTDKDGDMGFGEPIGQAQQYATLAPKLPDSAKNMVHGDSHACVTILSGEGTEHERTEIWCYGNGALVGNGGADGSRNQLDPAPVVWIQNTAESGK